MGNMNQSAYSLSKILVRVGALDFGDFLLSSGKESPYYVDLSLLFNHPSNLTEVIKLIERQVEAKVGKENFQRVAGVLKKGIPIASILSFRLKKPLVMLEKEDGSASFGTIEPDEEILLVDDMINTGLTMEKCIKWIRESAGAKIQSAFVVLDRLEGGSRRLREGGVKVHSLATIREIIDTLSEFGAITSEEYEIIKEESIQN